jgi:hypothetical protein
MKSTPGEDKPQRPAEDEPRGGRLHQRRLGHQQQLLTRRGANPTIRKLKTVCRIHWYRFSQ